MFTHPSEQTLAVAFGLVWVILEGFAWPGANSLSWVLDRFLCVEGERVQRKGPGSGVTQEVLLQRGLGQWFST